MAKNIVKITLLICIFCLISGCGKISEYINGSPPAPEKTPDIEKWEKTVAQRSLKISQIRKENPGTGTFEIEGFVTDNSYHCPCPILPSMLIYCSCAPPYIIIAEKIQRYDSEQYKDNEIKVLVETPKDFKKDKKYRFKVNISQYQSERDQISEVSLVAYRY